MCGIAGYIGPKEIDSGRVEECLGAMGRRGPDGTGSYRRETPDGRIVQLLHSRLSIIDLDRRSDQPFRIGSNVIVFNGEIYNYRELRAGLEKQGNGFRTEGDTEVLLQGLMAGGVKALEACDGMWAFAQYDEAAGRLRLSRDRFGEKPLYMYREAGGLYFGSEVKFIRALLGKPLRPNLAHLLRFLVNGYKAVYKVPETFFHGLEELPAGSVLEIEGRGEKAQRYWIPRIAPDAGMEYRDAVEGVRKRMLDSVKLRLRSDVPLAFCMSGGVDSNSLISIAKRIFGFDVQGFTISSGDVRYEEHDLVQAAVRELGIRHTSVTLSTEGFMDKLRTLVRYHDAPVFTITYYVHWLLMESIAKAGYKVSLSGTGADELFSGYYDHHLAYMQGVAGEPERHAAYLAAWEKHVRPEVRNPFLSNPRLFLDDRGFRDHIYLNAEGFAGCLAEPWHEPFKEAEYSKELLRNRMLNEMFHEAVPLILHEDDLNAMYYSIENRSPFLSKDLFEFCNSIPTRHLMRDGYTKVVLRDAMRGIVPDPILDSRRKVGFNAPLHSLIDLASAETRETLLKPSPIFEHIRRDKIKVLMEKASLPNSESKFLFYFLGAKQFLEEFAA